MACMANLMPTGLHLHTAAQQGHVWIPCVRMGDCVGKWWRQSYGDIWHIYGGWQKHCAKGCLARAYLQQSWRTSLTSQSTSSTCPPTFSRTSWPSGHICNILANCQHHLQQHPRQHLHHPLKIIKQPLTFPPSSSGKWHINNLGSLPAVTQLQPVHSSASFSFSSMGNSVLGNRAGSQQSLYDLNCDIFGYHHNFDLNLIPDQQTLNSHPIQASLTWRWMLTWWRQCLARVGQVGHSWVTSAIKNNNGH